MKSELEHRFGRFEEQIALRLGERSGDGRFQPYAACLYVLGQNAPSSLGESDHNFALIGVAALPGDQAIPFEAGDDTGQKPVEDFASFLSVLVGRRGGSITVAVAGLPSPLDRAHLALLQKWP